MKKIIRSILIFSFIISSLSFSIFADSNGKENTLTIEKAIEMALRNDIEIRKNNRQSDIIREQGELLNRRVNPLLEFPELLLANPAISTEFTRGAETINFNIDRIRRANENIVETTKLRAYGLFNSISQKESEIELLEEKLAFQLKNLDLTRTSFELGFRSEAEHRKSIEDFQTLQNEVTNKKEELNKEFRELNLFLGERDIFQRYDIEPVKYEFERLIQDNTRLEINIQNAINRNFMVWLKERNLDLKDLDIRLYSVVLPSLIRAGETPEPMSVKELELSLASTELTELRRDVRENVIQKYNSLIQLEKAIDSLRLNIAILERELELSRVRLDTGLMTSLQVKQLELQLNELKSILENQIMQHGYLKFVYENPALAGF